MTASEAVETQASKLLSSDQKLLTAPQMEPALLLLPETVLERILLATGRKGDLRHVCKTFSIAISKLATVLKVPRAILRNRRSILRALSTFPNSRRVVLDLSHSKHLPLDNDDSTQRMASDADDDAELVAGALDALAALRHPLKSLAVLHLSCAMPLPSANTLAYLNSCGLTELELQDVSIKRSASDGASNLLRAAHPPSLPGQLSLADSIRARGAAMVRFACSLPALQRLSLCNAAFSSCDVAALAALTQLGGLSLDGAMECAEPSPGAALSPLRNPLLAASSAAPTYKHLLAALPQLRQLQLPMPVACGRCQVELLDSDNDDDDRFKENLSASGIPTLGGLSVPWARAAPPPVVEDWTFPPQLEELTIPLCSLNGHVFRAACEAYGGGGSVQHAGNGGGCGGLRALHITCAPGYTVWEGSFLNAEPDFAAVSLLAPSLESLHLSLELCGSGRGALRRDRLRTCFSHLRALSRLKDLHIIETQQPVSFATRKNTGARPDVLSYLLDDAYEPRLYAQVRIPTLPRLGDQSDGARSWSSGSFISDPAAPATAASGSAPTAASGSAPTAASGWSSSALASMSAAPVSPSPSLDSLLGYWPELQTLAVCGQRAVRSSRGGRTRLVLPESLEELMQMRRGQQDTVEEGRR